MDAYLVIVSMRHNSDCIRVLFYCGSRLEGLVLKY